MTKPICTPQLVTGRRFIRKMRGGSQAHLIQADDGHCYVVKLRNNPQHRRVLVNEWISAILLRRLGITTPPTAFVFLSAEFLEKYPEVGVQLASRTVRAEPGIHFGSRYPGDPEQVAVYDFLPDQLLSDVVNLREFMGVLVFDKWTGNTDCRQAVFHRASGYETSGRAIASPACRPFVATMIDQGHTFNGPDWNFLDGPLHGLSRWQAVYQQVRGWDDLEPWLSEVVSFPERTVEEACRDVPSPWLEEDTLPLTALVERLLERRRRVPDLLDACRAAADSPLFLLLPPLSRELMRQLSRKPRAGRAAAACAQPRPLLPPSNP